jgi:hypothetical protein
LSDRGQRGAATAVLVHRAVGTADLHPVEEQLVIAQAPAALQDRDRAARKAAGELAW